MKRSIDCEIVKNLSNVLTSLPEAAYQQVRTGKGAADSRNETDNMQEDKEHDEFSSKTPYRH